jgi:hypothetical protein
VRKSAILGFEELLELWKGGCSEVSIADLLGLTVPSGRGSCGATSYPLETLRQRFRGTWWELVWPAHARRPIITRGVQCKYVGDSAAEALQRSCATW